MPASTWERLRHNKDMCQPHSACGTTHSTRLRIEAASECTSPARIAKRGTSLRPERLSFACWNSILTSARRNECCSIWTLRRRIADDRHHRHRVSRILESNLRMNVAAQSASRTSGQWFTTAKLPLLSGIMAASFFCNTAWAQQSAVDLQGNSANPFAASHGKVVVLVFVRRDCPVSSRYAPVIRSIGKRHQNHTNFFLVYPDKTDTPQQIRSYLRDYGYALPALRDPNHVLVKLAHVQITPEVAVFDGNHRLIYDGRI